MHFLIDASLPRAVTALIHTSGHQATDVRDIGLGAAEDQVIAVHARDGQMCLLSADRDFGNINDYPPSQFAGIVVIKPPPHANRTTVLAWLETQGLLRAG